MNRGEDLRWVGPLGQRKKQVFAFCLPLTIHTQKQLVLPSAFYPEPCHTQLCKTGILPRNLYVPHDQVGCISDSYLVPTSYRHGTLTNRCTGYSVNTIIHVSKKCMIC